MIANDDCRNLAVFTIVQVEPEFIHPWINHYKKHVAEPGDIYVLVHAPTPPEEAQTKPLHANSAWSAAQALMVDHHGVAVVPVHHASAFDHHWLAAIVSKFQSFLLQSYRWVLFAECDEFILPTPGTRQRAETLLDFVSSLGPNVTPAIRTTGFEIVRQENELPLSAALYQDGRNVSLTAAQMIDGCKFWYRSNRYSKTLLARTPIEWGLGFHEVAAPAQAAAIAAAAPSSRLTLVHLHKVDFDLALTRSRRSRARKWSKVDIESGRGFQNRIDNEIELRLFWREDHDTEQPMLPSKLMEILPGLKKALS